MDGVEAWLDEAEEGLPGEGAELSVEAPTDLVRARAGELRALPAMIAVYRASVAQARGDVAATVANNQAWAGSGPG